MGYVTSPDLETLYQNGWIRRLRPTCCIHFHNNNSICVCLRRRWCHCFSSWLGHWNSWSVCMFRLLCSEASFITNIPFFESSCCFFTIIFGTLGIITQSSMDCHQVSSWKRTQYRPVTAAVFKVCMQELSQNV